MTKNKLFMMLAMGSVAATLACDGASATSSGDLSTNDCPIGMFRPAGIDDCVFPAEDLGGGPLSVSDNRCASGQPAFPPVCISDSGERPYLAASTVCAPNYRYEVGACERLGNFDGGINASEGGFTTGFGTAGASEEVFDAAGAAGAAGSASFDAAATE